VQTRSQFSAYSILAAPMMISGSILDMTAETLKTYTNKEVTARFLPAFSRTGSSDDLADRSSLSRKIRWASREPASRAGICTSTR